MSTRLLAVDLDGTLANHDGHIGQASVTAIQRARAAGITVVVATGRIYTVITHYLDRIGVTDEPIISAQGALISYRDGRVLRRLPLDVDVARRAAEIAAPLGAGMAYFTETQIIVDRFVVEPERYQAWFGGIARLHPNAVDGLNGHLIKFMAIQKNPELVPALLDALKQQLGSRADITRSWDWFVEGTTPGADKGASLAWLCGRLNIHQEEVLAIGDGGNDVTMLRWAGYSAAPADADPAALAVADWVAPPLEEHPVAVMIDRFI